jgi:nucleotide-binding universal stress UspA family protein
MSPFHTILHATDFSPQACYAFRLACALAKNAGAQLVLVHVYDRPMPIYGDAGAVLPDFVSDREALREKLTRLAPEDPTIVVDYRLLEGNPAQQIVDLARELRCDLIVMGTHGRTGIGRLLMGSVAENVVRHANSPVLTVKTPVAHCGEKPSAYDAVHAG